MTLATLQSCSRSVDCWLPKRTLLWMPTTRKSVNPRSIANSTTDLRFVAEGIKAGRNMRSEDADPRWRRQARGGVLPIARAEREVFANAVR